jgi:hypothetical protein
MPKNHAALNSSRVQVSFPGVGELVRNRAGRIEFVFEQQLVDALELGLAPVSEHAGLQAQQDTPQPSTVTDSCTRAVGVQLAVRRQHKLFQHGSAALLLLQAHRNAFIPGARLLQQSP